MNFQFWTQLFPQKPTTPTSPDGLGQPVQSHPDVKRITQAPLVIVLILATIIGAGVGFTAYSKAQNLNKISEDEPKTVNPTADTPDWFEKHQKTGIITSENQEPTSLTAPAVPALTTAPTLNTEATDHPNLNASSGNTSAALTPYQETQFQQWQQQEMAKQQLAEQRRSTLQNALSAGTTVFSNNAPTLQGTVKQQGPLLNEPKLDANASPETANYLMHTRTPAVSPFEVKAGTVIPSVMLGGINSDLPGQIHAQVAQNVYDTARGQYLLIPQGSKLVGTYDHQVVSGQKRVLVIWNRLIYPDASSVTLEGMAGSDQSGYAGFSDKTNTHFWPTFRNALMLSAISAGVQLSQPRVTNGNYAYSSNQIAAGALGQQMNQVGMNTINRNINQPPTMTIRPGYVFNVMVNKDLILPPWQGHS